MMKKLVMLCGMLFATVGYCEYKITEVKPISPWAVVVEVEGDEDYAPHLIASNTVTHQVTSCEKQKVTRRAEGMYSIRWNFFEDNENWDRCNIAFGIVGKYCVIDLSAGDKATSYPVTYLSDVPVGGWTDEYKTNKLVLRLIDSGSFKMCGKYDVTLTKPYYIGVFEVTQKQYQLVTGKQPSDFSGAKLPVERVSWNKIRGNSSAYDWPTKKTVDSDSFVGCLRSRTGLKFDLPTEAQWEHACRAGTTTTYSYGNSENGDYMWYYSNSSSKTHEVGTKLSNAWGLFDMHGNVWEWCLDWNGSLSSSSDPEGSVSGSYRVIRGGSWYPDGGSSCTSSTRYYEHPGNSYSYPNNDGIYGFRLACSAEL